jgi:starch synthase
MKGEAWMTGNHTKKVAIIRGANLNKFEMQIYEPLCEHFQIEAFCIAKNNFSLQGINLPVHRLLGIEVLLPRILRKYYDMVFGAFLEMYQPMFGLRRRLKDFDVLHIPEVSYYYSHQAAQAKAKYGLKMVATHAENRPFPYGKTWLSRRRVNRVIEQVDLFLPLTHKAEEVLLLLGVRPERIEVVPFGIDVDAFKPEPKDLSWGARLGIDENDIVILFVGRINRGKGVYDLVYAAKKLLDDSQLAGMSIKFLLVGSGRAQRRVRKLARRLGIAPALKMVDNLEYDLMPRMHNLADIFVLPSIASRWWQEQFGMVLIESMACGKAVVATTSGSIPEVVGDAGLLVQPNDPFSLAEAIKELILNQELREELGKKGRQRAEADFSIPVVSGKLLRIYGRL